jgi:hypothetical protein
MNGGHRFDFDAATVQTTQLIGVTQSREAAILVERSYARMSHRAAMEKTMYCGTRTLRQAPIQALQVSEHARPRRCFFLDKHRPTGAYGDTRCSSATYKILDSPPWILTRSLLGLSGSRCAVRVWITSSR